MKHLPLILALLLALPVAAASTTWFSGSQTAAGLCPAPFHCSIQRDLAAQSEPCAPDCTYTAYSRAFTEYILPHDVWLVRDEYAPGPAGTFVQLGRNNFGFARAQLGPNETFLGAVQDLSTWQLSPSAGGCTYLGDWARMTTPQPSSTTILATQPIWWKVCEGSGETVVSGWSGP